MHFNRIAVILVFLLSISSCSGKALVKQQVKSDGDKPFWIEAPEQKYPKAFYISALGVSDTKAGAENDAYRGISQVFQSTVSSSVNLNDLKVETEESLSSSVSLIKDITIASNNQLLNTTANDYYYDDKTKSHYVLAVMDKGKTRPLYKAQYNTNNEQIGKWLNTADAESDAFKKMGAYQTVTDLLQANKALVEMLRILDEMGLAYDKAITEQNLKQRKDAVLEQLHIYVDTGNKFPKKLKDALKKELVNLGFKISKNKAGSVLVFDCDFESEPLEIPDNQAKFVSWTFAVNVIRTADNANISLYEKSGRSGQLSIKAAEQRAHFNLEKLIKKEFPGFLSEELFQ